MAVRLTILALLGLALAPPATAHAGPLGLSDCRATEGVYRCDGLVATWDGVPLDTTVTLPRGDARGLPLVVEPHGFGNSKYEYLDPASTAYTDNAYAWARDGYAVLTPTARGLWGSCGTPEARAASPLACARGYLHLADTRYEVRDLQELTGRLVDEGVADPKRIGVTGDSYGGGESLELAALRNRVMEPDGRLVPWRSPKGVALSLAAAAPVIPWSDLVGAIAPNGRTRAVGRTPPGTESAPVGVFKTTIANAIFAASTAAVGPGQPIGEPFVPGRPMGYLAPAGSDPDADVPGWVARSDQGEPYDDARAKDIVAKLTRFHSAYGIEPSVDPPPLLVAAGFTDDIFPVDETLRFVNRMNPKVPVSLLFGDFGHQRAANKKPERDRMLREIHAWFDHYVRGDGPQPPTGVVATTQTCPRSAPSEGPFRARTFAGLANAAVTVSSGTPQTLSSSGGSPAVGAAVDPVSGQGDGCATTPSDDLAGTATYRRPGGFLLLGAPSIDARLKLTGDPSSQQVAARLWDVAPDGRQNLVARGSYRPTGSRQDTWQLHPAAYRFAAGHQVKLELLGNDAPYTRASNSAFSITVESMRLTLPVRGPAPRCTKLARVRIPLPRGLRAARVTVQGHRIALLRRHGHVTAVVNLRRLPGHAVRVHITGRTRAGRAYSQIRRYRTC